MTTIDTLRARLFLLRAVEPPAPAVHHYVTVHGAIEAAARIRQGTAPPAVLAEITHPDPQIEDDLRVIDDGTMRLLTPEDDDWPTGRVNTMSSLVAPLALWVRGHASLAKLTSTAITITGTRVASEYGHTVAADFSSNLAHAGVTIVGGGSFGVEEAAHRATLASDGTTVVVLPCGVDQNYPHAHAGLYNKVVEHGGLLVSEYPITAVPTRTRLHARCRLLAAFTSATVIVEAGWRSGALVTARAAHALGRRVYGVPGPINSANSTGIYELLRTGVVTAITSPEDIHYQEGLR